MWEVQVSQYTTALKYFIEQKFPGALLMEEHQVRLYDWRVRCAYLGLNDSIKGMFYSIFNNIIMVHMNS